MHLGIPQWFNYLILTVLIIPLIIWPMIMVFNSHKSHGIEKTMWVLSIFYSSWIGWFIHDKFAPLKVVNKNNDNQD